MKKRLLSVTSLIFITFSVFFQQNINAVGAYPLPIEIKQPDNTLIKITLKGDEKVSWGETQDGYTILNNGKDTWEYAVLNTEGDLISSGILAHNLADRSSSENELLNGISKRLKYSKKQIDNFKSQAESGLRSTNNISGFVPSSNKKLLLILIGYTDLPFSKTQAEFDNLMNHDGYTTGGTLSSVKDFFLESSYGNFNITTTVAGPYTASNTSTHYGGNTPTKDANFRELIMEALTLADPDVNYNDYDNDGDGYVDGVYVIYAGYSEASGGGADCIWPKASSISATKFDDSYVTSFSCSNELNGNSGTETTGIGVICHEFGHVCGSPDFYDTDYETNGQFDGTGNWDIMAGGTYNGEPSGSCPPHFNPYIKCQFGWVTPEEISTSGSHTLTDVTKNPVIYKFNTKTAGEYFLLENRQQVGFNANVPGHGLMIFHKSADNYLTYKDTKHPQGFYPVCASATSNPSSNPDDYGNINSTGCPFPGTSNNVGFYDRGIPSSKSWAGVKTGMPITGISENTVDKTVSFTISSLQTCSPPTVQASSFFTNSNTSNSINISWNRGNGNNILVVCREGSPVDLDPFNGTTYTANSNYKNGDQIGSGNYVVYDGVGTSVNVTGLYSGSQYYFAIYEYYTADHCYLIEPTLTGNASTACTMGLLPYSEHFENKSFGCWSNVDNNVNGEIWKLGTYSLSYYTPNMSGNYAYLPAAKYGDDNSQNADLISPTFDLSGYLSVALKFKHDFLCYPGTSASVYYSIDNGITWSLLKTYNTSTATSSDAVFLSANAAVGHSEVKFKWKFTSTDVGYYWAIDDVELINNGNYWTGDISSEWNVGGNWSTGSVPGATSDVIIQSGLTNMPVISTAAAACQDITIQSGATLTISSSQELSVAGNWKNNGIFTAGTGTCSVNFKGATDLQTISGTSTSTFNILKVTKGALARILEVTSSIALTGTTNPLVITSGTFKLSVGSTIAPFTSSPTFSNLAGLWNNGGTINATSFNCIFNNGLIRNTSGNFNVKAINYYGSSSKLLIEGGTVNITQYIGPNLATSSTRFEQTGGTVNFGSAITTMPFDLTNTSNSFTMSGGEIIFQMKSGTTHDFINLSGTQNVTGGTIKYGTTGTTGSPTIRINSSVPIYNLEINNTGTPTVLLLSNLTVKNNILNGSTINTNNYNISVGGDFTNNGTFIPGTSQVTFNGTNAQNLGGSTSTIFNNLTLNNSNGLTLNGSVNTTVNGIMTFTSGVFDTDANKLIIGSTGSVVRTSGHVYGKMQKSYPTGTNVSKTFEVGDVSSSNYCPVSINFGSITTAGDLIVGSFTKDHLSINASDINPFKSVNLYWSLTNNGIVYSDYDGLFSFESGNLDASINTNNLIMGNYSSSSWSYPTLGTKTSTSSQIIGVSTFGDFQLAEGYTKKSIAEGGNWSVSSTWSPSGIPVLTDNVKISSPGTVIVDINDAICNDLVLPNGAKLEISQNKNLSVNGNIKNSAGNSGLVVKSDATGSGSLITGTFSEPVSANIQLYMTGNKWHMLSSPVVQSISDLLTSNTQIPTKEGTSRGMMDFNTASNIWNPYFTNDKTGNMVIGKGYFIRSAENTGLSLNGTLNSGPQSINMIKSGNNSWNIVGNPYASSIKINNNSGSENFLSTNLSVLDPDYVSIYVWDETYSTSQYRVINHSDVANYASIGQAFFIKAASNESNLQFKKNMQIHRNGNTLRSSNSTIPEIKLSASKSDKEISTSLRFIDGTTKGLDPGYDAGFLKLDASFGLYTRLVNDNGTNFAIQCLPLSEISNSVIAVGVDSKTSGEIIFSASSISLPTECSVLFEDKLYQTLTDLSKEKYSTTIEESLGIIDRFYLHTSYQTTVNDNILSDEIKIYFVRNSEILISGNLSKQAVVILYDIMGRTIYVKDLNEGRNNRLSTDQFSDGIYILRVKDNKHDESFKISIKH